MICNKCGAKMIFQKEGHSVCWMCDKCGEAVATTYFEPYETDIRDYRILIMTPFKATMDRLKMLANIMNCNYIEAKKMIENAPVEIFCGKAVTVKSIKEKLESAGIDITIVPEFPY